MENAEVSGDGDGLRPAEYRTDSHQPSPMVSLQEQKDLDRAIALSLEEYEDRTVLLPGVRAQMAMADEDKDKDIERPNTPEKVEADGESGLNDGTATHQEPSLEAGPSTSSTPHKRDPPTQKTKLNGPSLVANSQQTVGDRIKYLHLKMDQDIFLLNDADADTLVFIDPPPQQPEQGYTQYKEYREHCLKPHRVHSSKFLALGSSVITAAFGPTKQYRVLGKRGLRNNLPTGIKYVLDLSPPTEGEDAAYLMTELSCAMGVRMWFQSEILWDISKALVGGQEVFEYAQMPMTPPGPTSVPEESSNPTKHEAEPKSKTKKKESKKMNWEGELPKPPPTVEPETFFEPSPSAPDASPLPAPVIPTEPVIPMDYSPIRHRSAIERVLHAISGGDPKLDSAPKIWTFFAVAKYLDCAKHPAIGDWLIRWMYAAPNTYFIELHPDIACRVAEGVQCLALSRDAYAILVGEEALDNLRRTRDPNYKSRHQNSYGRAKEELTEDDQTRVEYGSKSFLERINKLFLALVDEDMLWLHDSPEFRKLLGFRSGSEDDMMVRQNLMKALKQYVRGRLFATLFQNQEGIPHHLKESLGWKNHYPNPSYQNVYNYLEVRDRIFTQSAWRLMNRVDVSLGDNSFSVFDSGTLRMGASLEALMSREGTNLKCIEKHTLTSLVRTFVQAELAIRRAAEEQAQLAALAGAPQATTSSTPLYAKPSTLGYTTASQDTAAFQSVLPDRTRGPSNDVVDIGKFENLSVHSPSRLADYNEGTTSRDKRRKLSVTEDVFVDADQSGNSTRSMTKANNHNSPGKCLPLRPVSNRFPSSLPSAASSYVDGAVASVSGEWIEPIDCSTASSYVESVDEDGFRVFAHASLLNQGGTVRESVLGASTSTAASAAARTFVDSLARLDVPGKRSPSTRSVPPHSHTQPVGFEQIDQNHLGYPTTFDLYQFFREANRHVQAVSQKMLSPANHELGPDALALYLTDTLVCLDDNEWKYLPLWAGGCDDGSGGVFIDGVPIVETGGFSAPGPSVHNGSAATSESSFEIIDSKTEVTNSRHTSTVVQDGFSDNLDRSRVYEADSLWDEVMANTEAKWAKSMDKGKAKASHVDENEDIQTMIAASVDHSSVKAGAMDDDANWEVGDAEGFGSDIDDGDDDTVGEMDRDDDDDEDHSDHNVDEVDSDDFEMV